MLDLKDTIELMTSENYQDRFKAEYYQTKIRYDRLHNVVVKIDAGTLDFEPACDVAILKDQLAHMGGYLYILEVRAQIEGIEL